MPLSSLFTDGIETLGFVMEDNGGDYLTVYIVPVPVVTVGAIHSVAHTRVKFLNATNIGAANCITKSGIGIIGITFEIILIKNWSLYSKFFLRMITIL
jgi:hypothetical protein